MQLPRKEVGGVGRLGNVPTIWTSSDSFVFIEGLLLSKSGNLLLLFFFGSNTNVDMSDLKVHCIDFEVSLFA